MWNQGKANPVSGSRPEVQFPQIDAVKGLAIILVIAYHAGGVMGWPNTLHGEVGVDLFLLVSGLLLSLHSAGMSSSQFIFKRLVRIYPAYWIALGLFVWGGGTFLRNSYDPAAVLVQLFGAHATWQGAYYSPINDSFWYISTILALYAAFLLCRSRTDDAFYLFGLGGLSTATALIPAPGFEHLAPRLTLFFVGIAIGHYLRRGSLRFQPGWVFAAGMITATAVGWARGLDFKYPVSGVGIAGALWWLYGRLPRVLAGRIALSPIRWLGRHSYGLFLVHQPLIRDYNLWWHSEILGVLPSPGTLATGIAVGIAISLILAYMIEHVAKSISHGWTRPTSGPRWKSGIVLALLPVITLAGVSFAPELGSRLEPSIREGQLRRALRPQAQPEYGGWPGPIILRLQLPSAPGTEAFPLLVTGAPGRADLLGLRRVSEHEIEFVIDHWGHFAWTSDPIAVESKTEHRVTIAMGSLLPPVGAPIYTEKPELERWITRLHVTIDGIVAFDRTMEFHPAAPDEVFIGLNAYGGSMLGPRYPRPIQSPMPLSVETLSSQDP